jgi:ABC-type oligopeptide transport system substrate-binding subunit
MKTINRILAGLALLCLVVFAPSACASTGTVVVGHSVTFYLVNVNGTTPFTFQWSKDGNTIAGATGVALPAGVTGVAGSAYTIAVAGAIDAGTYTVKVTNTAGSTVSDNAVLTVAVSPSGAVTGVQVTQNGVSTFYPFT